MTPYTYVLTHRPTGKRYYGVRYAKNCHPDDLWVTYFSSSKIIQSLDKNDFDCEIRRTFTTPEKAIEWESKVILRLKLWKDPNWLNKSWRGKLFRYGPHTDETKAKCGARNKGRTLTPEHRAKVGRKGPKHLSEQGKNNIAESNRLRGQSQFSRKKISDARKGKPMSEETKKKISQSSMGKPKSEETKRKISEAMKASRARRSASTQEESSLTLVQ
jgi:hypothetical protein